MRPYLDGLYSVDLPSGPPELPPDPEDCWVVVEADIGVEGESGSDTFTFYVCTLRRLAGLVEKLSFQSGRHLLIVQEFDWQVVQQAIESIISGIEGDSWPEVAKALGQFGLWEFDNLCSADGGG